MDGGQPKEFLRVGFLSERLVIDDIEVEVRRNSRRRTRIGLAFDPSGYLIMDAPLHAGDDEIRAIVSEHQRWLRVRLDKVKETAEAFHPPRYRSGELVHYLGEAYRLEVVPGRAAEVTHEALGPMAGDQLGLFPGARMGFAKLRIVAPDVATHAVKDVLDDWFKMRAAEEFAVRVEAFAVRLPWLNGASPPWRHSFMRSQWGSCSAEGKISLNTHLIKTPSALIDYVIVHELCHLEHLNHSKRFYALMSRHMPDWQRRRTQLNRYVSLLVH
jgi:predicted metal-dependent hydrolase